MAEAWVNRLYFGDNLKVLRDELEDGFVDLVYLDPPFNSNATYNVLFKERSGTESAAQITAFDDTWHWGEEAESAYRAVVEENGKLGDLLAALLKFLGRNDMMAYVTMMAPRLVELHRVLKPTGSLYLHCDPTASHYLKMLLDAIFGPQNFRTEIIWKRSSAHSDTKQGRQQHGRIHDVILFYTKSDQWTWNPIHTPYDQEYVDAFYRHVEAKTSRRYRLGDLTGPGGAAKGNPRYEVMGVTRYWRYTREKMAELIKQGRIIQTNPGAVPQYKRYLDEMPGVPLQDVWTDIKPIGAQAQERLGYPTQKPEALLERIIRVSSDAGDIVLDPFCGCGTTVAAAERHHRKWIGIDVTPIAIDLIRRRLQDAFGKDLHPYAVLGVPSDLAGAKALADVDRHQFEWWAVGMVGARPAQDKKKGADSGIDGRRTFFDDKSLTPRNVIVQVKSGGVSVTLIRDLIGTVQREKAEIGVFVTLEEPSKPMIKEAVSAGFYTPKDFPALKVPKIQIFTVAELLDGKTVQLPAVAPDGTFAKATKKDKVGKPKQGRLI